MNILNLPEEVIIIVIRHLDTKSLFNLYETCSYLRNIVCMHGIVKVCSFSLNTMSTANSLKLNFFKEISGHLYELNLRAVVDLTKTALLPAIKKLKTLKILDVSYTNINIMNLLEIHQLCPTIKDVSINFTFDKLGTVKIPQTLIEECQNMFQKFNKVHFVGALPNLFFSKLPYSLLCKASLEKLQFTISECSHTIYENVDCKEMAKFNQFSIYILNWKKQNQYFGNLNDSVLMSMLDLSICEFLVVTRCNLHMSKVIVSPLFKDFFIEQFNVRPITDWSYQELGGNVAIMVWNKESTKFDKTFFASLSEHLQTFFPYHILTPCSDALIPPKNHWCYTTPTEQDFTKLEIKNEPDFKKRRIAPRDVILDYDNICRNKQKIQISIIFKQPFKNPITLSKSCTYLDKITYLNLSGHVIYSQDFFKILFYCCNHLVTLISSTSPNTSQALLRFIPVNKYIKNLRLVASTIDFKFLWQSLSQCRYLENVYLVNETSGQDLGDPQLMLEKCNRLYNLSIVMPIGPNTKTKKMQMLNKTRTMLERRYLNIELNDPSDNDVYGYDPFIEVFNLNPIKVL